MIGSGVPLSPVFAEQGYEYGALVTFSGTVRDGGIDHTEANLNGIPETQTTAFAKAYFALRAGSKDDDDQSELYRILDPVKQRFVDHLDQEAQEQVRSDLNEFVRLYAFLSQIVTFSDAELERLYLFSRYLKRVLPVEREHLPREIQDQIDMESYGIRETASGTFTPERGTGGELDPRGPKDPRGMSEHRRSDCPPSSRS
jgi:hypothetical protein